MWAAAVIGRINASSKTILNVLCLRENCFCLPRDSVWRTSPHLPNQMSLKCSKSQQWVYLDRLGYSVSSVWSRLATMGRNYYWREVDGQNPPAFVLHISISNSNGLSLRKTSAMPILPLLIMRQGGIAWVSSPTSRTQRLSAPDLIVPPIPPPLKSR